MRLGPAAFRRARGFIEESARPLERARFAYRFQGGSPDAVRDRLADYVNEDGGFGHALEPDVRTPTSSALATALALRTLREIGGTADEPLVRGAVAWAVSNLDEGARVWRAVPADANDHPHAPWWHDEDGSLARTFDGFRLIPRALLVAVLRSFSKHVPAAWLDDLTEATVREVEDVEVLGGGGGSDLEYAVHLARTDALPEHYRERLVARIRRAIPSVVMREPILWTTYCVTPLRAVPSPDSIGADLVADVLPRHLDFLIEVQAPDGGWEPTWTYEYPESWAFARQEWRGILTLAALNSLAAFDRLG